MSNNILKNVVFILMLSYCFVNSNLRAEEPEEDLTEVIEQDLTELETIRNNGTDTQQNDSQHFPKLYKEVLLKDGDKKEIRNSKAAKIGENADLIFNIIESAKNNFNKITQKNKKIEKLDQEGMKSAFQQIIIKVQGQSKRLSDSQSKQYRELLYLSLDWDKDLLEKFKDQLIFTIEKVKTTQLHTQMVIVGINIEIESQNALKTVCCNDKTKNKLYNKLDTQSLEQIKNNVNKIMNLRKEWQELINNNDSFFHNALLKKANEIYETIEDVRKDIQIILGYNK